MSGQIGVTKILHSERNTQEWIELFDENRYGTAIIIMGNEYDGSMFIVTKRQGGSCFIQQIYNSGGYNCYKSPDESVANRVVLSVGRQNNETWYTRDIIVMGSVY